MEVGKRVFGVYLNCFLEVFNGVLVVAHLLINQTSLNVNCFIVWKVLLNFIELLQSLLMLLFSAIHETQMEHRGDESLAVLEGFVKHLNGKVNQVLFMLTQVWIQFSSQKLSLRLESKSFGMIEFCIVII